MTQPSRSQVLQNLKEQLEQIQRSHRPRQERSIISTGLQPFDRLFPGGGLADGSLVEWLAGPGSGAATLAVVLAQRIHEDGGAVIVIDQDRDFYPPAAIARGIDSHRMVVVQPATATETLWAWEQCLRSVAVSVVLGRLDKLGDRVFRRLQLAAETGGTHGFLLRPLAARSEPSWANVRLLVQPKVTPTQPSPKRQRGSLNPSLTCRASHEAASMQPSTWGRRLRIEVLYCPGGVAGQAIELELSDETNALRLVPPLADSAKPPCSARA